MMALSTCTALRHQGHASVVHKGVALCLFALCSQAQDAAQQRATVGEQLTLGLFRPQGRQR